MFEFSAGVVNVGPVNIGVPPSGLVYQLNIAPAVPEEAVKVVVCPALIARVGGVTVIEGIPLMVTDAGERGDVALVAVTTASA